MKRYGFWLITVLPRSVRKRSRTVFDVPDGWTVAVETSTLGKPPSTVM
jgi:hypothetical protein